MPKLIILNSKPPECAGCVLEQDGKGFVPDEGDALDYACIGEAPGKTEIAKGRPFEGQAGWVLKNWGIFAVPALRRSFEQRRIYFGNCLRCLPPEHNGRPYPTGETKQQAEAQCRQFDRWRSTDVPTVFLFGEYPQRREFAAELVAEDASDRAAGREVKGVMGRIGRIYHKDNKRYVFAPHPAFVLRQPVLAEHLQHSLHIGVGTERKMQPQIGEGTGDIAFDLEWANGQIGVVGAAWDSGRLCKAMYADSGLSWLLDRLIANTGQIIGHNIYSADFRELAKLDNLPVPIEQLEAKGFDTLLAHHVVSSHLAGSGSYDLRTTVLLQGSQGGERFPLDWKDYEGDILKTCREDAAASAWVAAKMKREITRSGLQATCDISHQVAPMFARMRERGVRLDKSVLDKIHVERKRTAEFIIEQYGLWEWRGKKTPKKFPVWRSDKVLDIFESKYGVRPANRQSATWESLAQSPKVSPEGREFAAAIVKLGEGANDAHWLGKASETDDGVLTFGKVDANGFIYPSYNITGSPDRPTTADPSIQNWPRPSDDPRVVPIRSAVIPPEDGMVLLSVDFGSVETYTNAIEADDWDRVRAIQQKRVSHEGTAQMLNSKFGLSLTRQDGKTVNHAFDKAESPYNLAVRMFGVKRPSPQQTQMCRDVYAYMLNEFPKTAQFRDQLWERAKDNPLIVRNKFGRRLACFARSKYGEQDGWRAEHDPAKKYWCSCADCAPRRERFKGAIAFLGRSSAVDVLLRRMWLVWAERRCDQYSLPYAEIHDEGVWPVPVEYAQRYADIVRETFSLPVPELGDIQLPAEAKWGTNWSLCK